MSKAALSSPILGLVLVLAGCGGGGGGGGGGGSAAAPVDLVAITSANAKTLAGAAVLASLEPGNFGAFAVPAAAAVGVTSTQASRLYAKVGALQGAEAASLVERSRAGYLHAPIGPETGQCAVGGSVTVAGDIASQQTLSPGDALTLTFADCDDGVTVADGLLALTITSFSGSLDSGQFSLSVTLELEAFEVVEEGETIAADGDVTLTIDALSSPTLTITVASGSLAVGGGGASHTLSDYSLSQTVDGVTGEYSIDAAGAVTSSAFAGAATFETLAPFAGTGSGRPLSGELLITGAGGATIRLTVLDTSFVRLEIDTDGDGVADEVTDASWTELT